MPVMLAARRVRWFHAVAVAAPLALILCGACGGAPAPRRASPAAGARVNPLACGSRARTDLGRRMQAFLDATVALETEIAATETALRDACAALGHGLGLPGARLAGGARAVCVTVSDELDAALAAARLASAATPAAAAAATAAPAATPSPLVVRAQPVACTVDMNAAARALAACTGSAAAPLRCRGTCQGTCASGCAGTCAGRCQGTCQGNVRADGTCSGVCQGVCAGVCQGTCDGACTGTGACLGHADAQADPACEARAELAAGIAATCASPTAQPAKPAVMPAVTIILDRTVVADARLDAVVRALHEHMPAILRLRARAAGPLRSALHTWGRAAADLVAADPDALQPLGGRAACVFDQLLIAAARLAVMHASLTAQLEASAALQAVARLRPASDLG
jgi:hypothetical protein